MTEIGHKKGENITGENTFYLIVLFSISMLQMSGMNISPALQKIASEFPNVTEEAIQSLVTLPSLFIVFASLYSDYLARRISRKRTILLGASVFVVAGILPMFTHSFQAIRISRMLIGVGTGMMLPLNTTLLFGLFSDEKQRNTIIGWQSCASALGNVLATTLAGILAGIHYRLTFLVHLLGLLTLLSTLLWLPQDQPEQRQKSLGIRLDLRKRLGEYLSKINLRMLLWFLIMFLYMGYLNAFSTKISLLVETSGIGNSAVSALGISLLTVGSFIGGLFYGKVAQVLKQYTFSAGALCSALGILLMALANHPPTVYLSSVFTGLGLAVVTPVILVNVVEASDADSRTFVIAVNSAMSNLGLSLSPFLTSATAVLFIGTAKTIRDEYLVSAIALCVMGVIALFCTVMCASKRKRTNS